MEESDENDLLLSDPQTPFTTPVIAPVTAPVTGKVITVFAFAEVVPVAFSAKAYAVTFPAAPKVTEVGGDVVHVQEDDALVVLPADI